MGKIKTYIILAILSAHASAFQLTLPADERDLPTLLEEQTIDTSQYEQLLVFYALPLSVPQGELAYLAGAFPEIEESLPSPEQLDGYRPFDNRQIQRLLGDFPILADFEPILRFNVTESERRSGGEVIFGVNKSPADELRGQRIRFRYKSPIISTDGSAALSDSGAMWQNRRVGLSYKGVSANLGNFKQPIPGELIYGRFPPLDNDDRSSITSNWVYASGNSWNGASLDVNKIPGIPILGMTAFGHARPGERGGGGGISASAGKRWKAFASVTGFNIDTVISTDVFEYLFTAHLYGEYKDKTWRAAAELGMPLDNEGQAPAASLRLNHKIKSSYAEYHSIYYPQDYSAPLSRVKRQTLNEIGIRDTALSPPIQKHALRISAPLTDNIKITPEIDFTQSEDMVKRVYGRAALRARNAWTDISVKHSSKIFTTAPDSMLHTSGASVYLRTDYPLELRTSCQRAYGYYKDARNTYTAELICDAIPNAVIAPFASGRYVTEHTYRFGVKTELHLYKKTWTSITVEIPAGVKGDDNVYIKGASSYAF